MEEVAGKAGRLATISMLKKVLKTEGEGCEEPRVAGGISINSWLLNILCDIHTRVSYIHIS